MKKIGAIVGILMIIFMATSTADAAGFGIEGTSPKDGATGVPLENMGVKVFFTEEVYSKNNKSINEKACKLIDEDGKEVESMVIFNPKDKNVALVLAKPETSDGKTITIKPTTKYTLIIDETFTAANGNAIGKTQEISFETLNPSSSMKISMGMMGVMVVGMVIASSRAMKNAKKDDGNFQKEEKFNPYKVAKETGKPLAEVIAAEKKRREKEEAKAERKANHDQDETEEYMEPGHFKVKKIRTVSEGGSSYITGKKAEALKKAEQEAKIKAEKAANKNKKTSNKKKK